MKLNKLTLIALVALGAVACDKNDGINNEDNTPRTVTISLANAEVGSRALEPAAKTDDKAQLNTAYVMFADADGKVVNLEDDDPNKAAQFIGTITDDSEIMTPTGVTFHELPSKVEKVAILGNVEEMTARGYISIDEALEASKKTALEIQQGVDILVLFGQTEGALEEITVKDQTHMNYYKATVNLAPLVARIEVVGIQCTDLGTDYSKLAINQIAVANFYTESGEVAKVDNFNEYFTDAAGVTKPDYSFDVLNPTIDLTDQTEKTFTTQADVKAAYAYNVYPGLTPQIMLSMDATLTAGGDVHKYIAAEKFNGDATLKAGHIYQVKFVFTEKDVTDFDTKCIMVVASVKPWTVVPLQTTFN